MDATRTIKTVDVQLLNASRERPRTYKFDNPKDNLTRAQISQAFTTALSNSWLLAGDGSIAMYIGDIIINTSIKTSLDGEDFYVTPNSLTLKNGTSQNVTVTGAAIQGYRINNFTGTANISSLTITIASNSLSATVLMSQNAGAGSFNFILVIQGQSIKIPCTYQN